MKISDKFIDIAMCLQAIGFIGCVVCGMLGNSWIWFFTLPIYPVVWILVGSSHKQVFSKKLLYYPWLAWVILYTIGIYGETICHLVFMDSAPPFNILGMHPGEFFTYFPYWIGGMLTIGLGFALKANDWCPKEDWNEFLAIVNSEKKEEEGTEA